jgi:peptidoglycan/xylan/chitin deacetylase (PgdA/CDA1 family)
MGPRDPLTPLARAVKRTMSVAVRCSGLPVIARHTYGRRGVAILVYHDPASDLLDRHLTYLGARYAFLPLDDLVDALHSGCWDAIPSRSVVITVDDGRRGNYALLEVFRRHAVTPTLFICSQVAGTRRRLWMDGHGDIRSLRRLPQELRLAALEANGDYRLDMEQAARTALSRAEIDAMRGAVRFGSHTRFHPILTTCSDVAVDDEVVSSRRELELLTAQRCVHFSYPNGDYSAREVAVVKAAGYRSARTVDIGWNRPRTDPYLLKVLGVEDHASISELAADLAGFGLVRRARFGTLRGKHRQTRPSVPRTARRKGLAATAAGD